VQVVLGTNGANRHVNTVHGHKFHGRDTTQVDESFRNFVLLVVVGLRMPSPSKRLKACCIPAVWNNIV
jgi:hypothetical protein